MMLAGTLHTTFSIYVFVALFLLATGIVGVIYRRHLIGMLISMELIMNGAGLNIVAINRFLFPDSPYGMVFTLFLMGIAAAESAIALAIIILLFRKGKWSEASTIKELKD
jgi:NADH:ubiquinone oxidoreductase subunit K